MQFDDTQAGFAYKTSSPHSSVYSEGQSYPKFALPRQALVDWKDMPMFRLQFIINHNWLLQGKVTVKAKHNNFFILEFANTQDKQFMLENGPWTVQNSLLTLYDWQPGITVENFKVGKVAVWLRFTGVPMEFICNRVAFSLGQLAGEKVWVTCTPERAYRVCEQCGRLGHLDRDCNWTVHKTFVELQCQRNNLFAKFGYDYWIDTQHVLFECPKQKSQEWLFRGSTLIQMGYNMSTVAYKVFEQYSKDPSLTIYLQNQDSEFSQRISKANLHSSVIEQEQDHQGIPEKVNMAKEVEVETSSEVIKGHVEPVIF
ncbi:reverse transcriptase [Senna tora]|uniref:Reverse transcriptase n=1 Tax=Senna tora TaxID=362788 RepID=A0A834TKE6_9FABA|nr:reverse transcriptase [Senna tora]